MKNFWQPSIDNWILKENDANNSAIDANSKFSGDFMAGGSNFPLPVKSEEEENHDTLKQSYKGITTFSRLKDQINRVLEDVYNLSKVDKENKGINPYENIIQMLDNPDLKSMLDIASNEIKEKNLSSF
jgi:hypothetical protein